MVQRSYSKTTRFRKGASNSENSFVHCPGGDPLGRPPGASVLFQARLESAVSAKCLKSHFSDSSMQTMVKSLQAGFVANDSSGRAVFVSIPESVGRDGFLNSEYPPGALHELLNRRALSARVSRWFLCNGQWVIDHIRHSERRVNIRLSSRDKTRKAVVECAVDFCHRSAIESVLSAFGHL